MFKLSRKLYTPPSSGSYKLIIYDESVRYLVKRYRRALLVYYKNICNWFNTYSLTGNRRDIFTLNMKIKYKIKTCNPKYLSACFASGLRICFQLGKIYNSRYTNSVIFGRGPACTQLEYFYYVMNCTDSGTMTFHYF